MQDPTQNGNTEKNTKYTQTKASILFHKLRGQAQFTKYTTYSKQCF